MHCMIIFKRSNVVQCVLKGVGMYCGFIFLGVKHLKYVPARGISIGVLRETTVRMSLLCPYFVPSAHLPANATNRE